jgi:hypothetical protein
MPKYPCVRKKGMKWYYRLQYKGARIEQGSFDSAEEAHQAPPRASQDPAAPQPSPNRAHRKKALCEIPRGARTSVQSVCDIREKRGYL